MRPKTQSTTLFVSMFFVMSPAAAQEWVEYINETEARLLAPANLGVNDIQEKDYAWGDLDQDGDTDLVCVRKEPFNTPGRFRNVLFMNEGLAQGHRIDGVLVDRTADFAAAGDDGGQGLLDETADRDIAMVDLNGDGWLDLVTSTTYGERLPKTISHPRVYLNQGRDGDTWLGLQYVEALTPTMPIEPNFCGVTAGDVNGDGAPDLYFVDYDNDLEDRLWINNGQGAFTDQTEARLTFEMRESDFGVAAVIADMNGDGANDIVKDRGSGNVVPPLRISISYNNPEIEGFFNEFDVVYNGNPYHVDVADLNGDGLLDIIIEDDGNDRYYLNQGNGGDGLAEFVGYTFSIDSDSFGGNIMARDLDNDGDKDVVICDVDVDCCGCDRFMRIYENLGGGAEISFNERSGEIPIDDRTGTHDVAVFDINGDGWLDYVIGTCSGTSVWIAKPIAGVNFDYPDGLPANLVPGVPQDLLVQLTPFGDNAIIDQDGATLNVSINGDEFETFPIVHVEDDQYIATFPAVACLDSVNFYLTAELTSGDVTTDPVDAPETTFATFGATSLKTLVADNMEGDVSAWSIESVDLSAGEWEAVDPNGTIWLDELAAPEDDATPGADNVRAFVTENGPPGGDPFSADVDGGPTDLISEAVDLADADGVVTYARWHFSETLADDVLATWISNDDGESWVEVHSTAGTGSAWETVSFRVGDFIEPTDAVRVRFSVIDNPSNSVTESGIDDVVIEKLLCSATCPADLDADGVVGGTDLIMLLGAWGTDPGGPPDFDGNGVVDGADLIALLGQWGPCR